MPNPYGIDDHNGPNAEDLAKRYHAVDNQAAYPKFYKFLKDKAASGEHLNILDIGAGSGDHAYEMASLGHHVVAIEPSDLRAIGQRDRAHQNIDYRDGMLPALQTVSAEEQFDAVLLSTVWQYIDPNERVASLVRIAKALKPGGTIAISYPSPPSREHQYEASPEMLKADIEAANAFLSKSRRLSISGEPVVVPDIQGRKSVIDQKTPVLFYMFTLENGHRKSLGPRQGWIKTDH